MNNLKFRSKSFLLTSVMLLSLLLTGRQICFAQRKVVSLDGYWQIEQGEMDEIPDSFSHTIPVPGLVDMAEPLFTEVGIDSRHRQAFWYRNEFSIDGNVPDVARLMIHKAKYGMRVYLNGQQVAEVFSCFTPLAVNVKDYLKGSNQKNELIVRVGATRSALPKTVADGWDFEKRRYIPGIYDSVELILSRYPFIQQVQAVPEISSNTVRIVSDIRRSVDDNNDALRIDYVLRECKSGKIVANSNFISKAIIKDEIVIVPFDIKIPHCVLWTPENPFLYEVELKTHGDSYKVRFGMRTFRFDPQSGRALLNDKVYYMRGTNVCILRFFEDKERNNLPWNKEWVRNLHRKFKTMNWNSIRYCIGFPPDFWYDIADEEGLLIQDEFPIWYSSKKWPAELKARHLIGDYTHWMQHRWNHPCVVIWDAQNETVTDEIGIVINSVRNLDLSNRPWDNGWAEPQSETDCMETHPYIFIRLKPPYPRTFEEWVSESRIPHNGPTQKSGKNKIYTNPIIINEYGWLWLNRDGTPTRLSKSMYDKIIGKDCSVDKYRYTYARYLAAMTEYWRAHRKCAGVLHFCGLGYSLPGKGETSDNFIDVANLKFEPYFEKYVKDAFSPISLMIDKWQRSYPAGSAIEVPIFVINDLYQDKQGRVKLFIRQGEKKIQLKTKSLTVPALGREIINFALQMPTETGKYDLIAELIGFSESPVKSVRSFSIGIED
ncbi:MAG: hypothetical protein JXD22_12790 [Sedimentisphaerales bacterium]|nr:hypothetical protein [Sedimentisphaerales bacterium]